MWLTHLRQHDGFVGSREDALEALQERFGHHEWNLNGLLDYLYGLDVGMDELIRE